MYGAAVLDACTQLADRLAPYRAKMPNASVRELANAAWLDRVDLCAHGFYKTPDVTGFGGTFPFNYFCFGSSVSEVELDTLTGDFHVLRTDIVMDVGNPINPAIDIGQVEGGFVQVSGPPASCQTAVCPPGSTACASTSHLYPSHRSCPGLVVRRFLVRSLPCSLLRNSNMPCPGCIAAHVCPLPPLNAPRGA